MYSSRDILLFLYSVEMIFSNVLRWSFRVGPAVGLVSFFLDIILVALCSLSHSSRDILLFLYWV